MTSQLKSCAVLALLFGTAVGAPSILAQQAEPQSGHSVIPLVDQAPTEQLAQGLACLVTREVRTVRGNSMDGIVEPGRNIELLNNYYRCHEPARGDLVVYEYSGIRAPALKIVQAVPGDRYGIRKDDGVWHVIVNDQVVTNANGRAYELSDRAAKMLGSYDTEPAQIIPKDRYLILGNVVSGSRDSTRFGLAARNHLLGKAVLQIPTGRAL